MMLTRHALTAASLTLAVSGASIMTGSAQTLAGPALTAALRSGAHVIVMRHATSPGQPPDKQTANADNVTLERQLDAAGRAGATAMGEALRRLSIPIGEVLTSPTYRARETVRYAQLGNARAHDELGDEGQSMKIATEQRNVWLRKRVAEMPRGANTVIVTHLPNISGAFPDLGDMAQGEAAVFAADGQGGVRVVARIPIAQWGTMK
jgi:phosphohistidine phosphatase SixA